MFRLFCFFVISLSMERANLEQGSTHIVSDSLAKAGYEEIISIRNEGEERFIKIPEAFQKNNLFLPDSISKLPQQISNSEIYINIPPDSIPLSIFDIEIEKNNLIKYSGIVVKVKESVEEIKRNNHDLVQTLNKENLQVEDILIVSIDTSQIIILL